MLALCVLHLEPTGTWSGEGWPGNGQLSLPGVPSPAHARLFTPRGAPADSYRVTVLDVPLDQARAAVMLALEVPASPPAGSGPWAVRRLEVAEAFGASGTYDRTRLARLFRGRRAQVARGPVVRQGLTVASVTLISPYPDPTLSRLETGTMVILLDVSRRPPSPF